MADQSHFESQRAFVKHVIANQLLGPAVVIGLAGFYSVPFMFFLGRVLKHTTTNHEWMDMLIVNPLKTLTCFMIAMSATYLLSRALGGRKLFTDYVIANGYIGIYFLCVSFITIAVSLFSTYMSETDSVNTMYVIAVFVAVIICIFVLIFTVKYGMVAVSEASGFESLKSFIVWIVSFAPVVSLYTMWVKG